MTSYHYHVYFVDANKVSQSFRFDTKIQATRKMASLKKDCQLQGEEWDGQIRWGCLESKEYNNRYIYGKKHNDKCVQIDHGGCNEEHGIEVMGWTSC